MVAPRLPGLAVDDPLVLNYEGKAVTLTVVALTQRHDQLLLTDIATVQELAGNGGFSRIQLRLDAAQQEQLSRQLPSERSWSRSGSASRYLSR
ncbi:MAG: hypothetical protein R3E95_18850 [Thiolinea sp.]